jgi:hypothetical protein
MIFDNPEFVRHRRVALRHPIASTSVILSVCLIITFIIYLQVNDMRGMRYSTLDTAGYEPAYKTEFDMQKFGTGLFWTFYVLAALVLLLYNNYLCLRSISYEVEQKTYDFQQTNLQTPFELMVGKVLGTPVFGHFMVLLAMPFIILGGILAEIPLINLIGLVLVLYMFSLCTNMLSVLLSFYIHKGASFIAPIILIAAFYLGAIGSETPFSFFSPIETITALAADETYEVSFFGYLYDGLFLNIFLYLFFIYWLAVGITSKLKKASPKFTILSLYSFLLSIQLVILGLFWFKHPKIVQSQYYFRYEETITEIGQGFFAVLVVLLPMAFLMATVGRDQVYRWFKNLNKKTLMQNIFSDDAPTLMAIGLSAVSAVVLYSAVGSGYPKELEAYLVMAFFVLFVMREMMYFSVMELAGIKFLLTALYLGLFYILGSIAFGILRSDLIFTIVPLMPFFGSSDIEYTLVLVTVSIEVLILAIIYFLQIRNVKRQVRELENK